MPVVWVDQVGVWQRHLREPSTRNNGTQANNIETPESFHIYRPSRWLGEYFRPSWLVRAVRQQRLTGALDELRRAGCTHPVLYLWRPEFSYTITAHPWAMTLYHVDDEYSFSETVAETPPHEMHVLRSVDQVIVHSPGLLSRKGQINPRTALIPNGVDYDAFSQPQPAPDDLRSIPRPRIGYVGVIKRQLDLELILQLARRHPEYSFVFVGPIVHPDRIGGILQQLRAEPNVHLLGNKNVRELPAYTQHLDVGLLCYRVNDYTNCIYPLKLHEYLASGIPAVSSAITAVVEHSSVVTIAHGVDEWSGALAVSLAREARSSESVARRRDTARAHDWNRIAMQVHDLILRRLDE